MKGYIGCDEANLKPGTVVVTGHNLEMRVVIVAQVTEEQARESAEAMGMPLVVVPGETFYEVDVTTNNVGSSN